MKRGHFKQKRALLNFTLVKNTASYAKMRPWYHTGGHLMVTDRAGLLKIKNKQKAHYEVLLMYVCMLAANKNQPLQTIVTPLFVLTPFKFPEVTNR